jgi:hypothetical protein
VLEGVGHGEEEDSHRLQASGKSILLSVGGSVKANREAQPWHDLIRVFLKPEA